MLTLFNERYEVLEALGSGGEARVFKALDRRHDRYVALKVRPVPDEAARQDLLGEARVLLALPPHPALPLVREDFFDRGDYVVAMDWVDGTDLATLLGDRGRPGLAPSSVLAHLAQAAEALTHLHTQSPPVIHGDVKPGNLILTRGGRIKLVDFGLSSVPDAPRRRAGTPGYRAPELAAGGGPSRATDVYALAATAFALLTGSAPAGVLPDWAGIAPEQAAQLEAAIRLGMATDPARRPTTPGEFAERLRAGWESGLPTGVVTFCCSDIEGSTALWERHPEAMPDVLVRHDELIADAVEARGGSLIQSMGEGDSTVSVFDSAPQAVDAAVAATRALAAERWPENIRIAVRWGVHTGETQTRNTDHLGPTVNLAARLRGQADGGQVFLSEVTAGLVAEHLPEACALVDLGPHRLKGLGGSRPVFALRGPGVDAPAPATECPYRGLLAFEAGDERLFFGREAVVAEVRRRVAPGRLLAVVGASGSGKSSVLRAGLVAAAGDALLITPGTEPPLALPDDHGRLLVVDQFEELWTLCDDPTRRGAFAEALLGRRSPVAIGLRADLYGALGEHPELARAVAANTVLLGAMTPAELERAITEPARLAGLRLEPGLVELILRDVASEPGALPLLSHALRATWERRDGRTLTVEGYRASGGVASAIARTADTVLEDLPDDQRSLARGLFLRLTDLGEGAVVSRRRVTADELVPAGGSVAAAGALVGRLSEARLVTLGDGTVEVAHEALIREWPQLRGWIEEDQEGLRAHRRLGDAARLWDAGGREPSDLYRGARLASALDFGADHEEALNTLERAFLDESRLVSEREALRGRRTTRRLRTLLAWALLGLVAAVAAAVVALDQRTDARRAATVADAQRLGTQALTDDDLDRALLLARAGVALDDSIATRGNLLSTLLRVPPGSLGALPGLRDVEIYSVALSPRGDRLAIGDGFGEVQLFDPRTRRRLRGRRLPAALIQRLAYSPDGSALAVTSLDPDGGRTSLDVLDAGTLRRRLHVVLPVLPKPVDFMGASAAFLANGRDLVVVEVPFPPTQPEVVLRVDGRTGAVSPRGFRLDGVAQDPALTRDHRRVLVTSARDDVTYELDPRDLRVVARHPAGGAALALDAADTTIAVGDGDGRVRLVDRRTGQVRRLAGRQPEPIRLHFTPDGSALLGVGLTGRLTVWDTASGRVRERFTAHAGEAHGLVVTPDGRTAITSGVDGRVRLWDLARDRRLVHAVPLGAPFEADGFTPRGVAMSPDGTTLAVTQGDGTVDLVDTASLARRDTVRTGPGAALAVAFSPDGRLLAVSGEHGRVGLWDARTLAPVGRLEGLQSWTQALAFSPDSRRLAASDTNFDPVGLRMWDVRRRTVTGFRVPGAFNAVAFSPHGRVLAAAGAERGTEVRDVRTGRLVVRLQAGELARSVAFSPDGRLLFTGLLDGSGQFYSTRTWRPVGGRVRGQGQRILNPVFTPDGRTLATSSADGTVLLWDVATRRPIGAPYMVQRESFVAAAMSRDGASVYGVPTGANGVRIALSPQEWQRQACAIAGRELSRREWRELLPSRPYEPVCAGVQG